MSLFLLRVQKPGQVFNYVTCVSSPRALNRLGATSALLVLAGGASVSRPLLIGVCLFPVSK